MKPNRKILVLPILTLAAFVLLIAPHGLAVQPSNPDLSESPWVEETLFLGEAVPLRHGGSGLEALLLEVLGETDGTCRWLTDHGPEPLEKLAQERPRRDTDYRLKVSGSKRSLELIYRVRVVTGSLTVQVDRPALIKIESGGLTLYRLAQPTADFTGLPFGAYTISVEGGSEEVEICYLGLCQEDDTIDPGRDAASVTLTLADSSGIAASQRFKVEGQP